MDNGKVYNWSTDLANMGTDERERWELEQQINYGLRGGKIKRGLLAKYWQELSIDPARRHFLEMVLHD